jgi:Family of unknown function (DUF6441)
MAWRYDPKTEEFKKGFLLAGNVIAEAANGAVAKSAQKGVEAGKASIAGAGFSRRWQNSLRFKMITPKNSLEPVAYIHTTINYADIFETGGDIHGDPLLWLPLPSVPGAGRRRHMTPAQYVKNVGPLISIRRAGKRPLLAAVIRRGAKAQPFGKFATRGQLKRGTAGRGKQTTIIPLFVGVPSVHIGKKWDVTGALKREADKMPQYYEDELRRLDAQRLLEGAGE